MTRARSTVLFVPRGSLALSLFLVLGSGCERTTNLTSRRLANVNPVDAGARDAASDARAPVAFSDAGVVLCGKQPCACNNGRDDDDDGLVDGFDGECTGPYDHDEATFATGEDKSGNPHCSDCFFDGNPGHGDDGCDIATRCGSSGSSAGAPGSCDTCEPTAACVNSCLPRTPNGCDCFGCCEVAHAATTVSIQLVDSCTLKDLGDPEKCPRCMPSPDCKNECGRCELCPGKPLEALPSDCEVGSGPGFTCDDGTECSGDGVCAESRYCVQGCCVPLVL